MQVHVVPPSDRKVGNVSVADGSALVQRNYRHLEDSDVVFLVIVHYLFITR